ncbi:flagellar hook capping FlgD N-terminal domain-containing protein [Mahella australiensis]|uniref:Flagellar hook capping protein n=1 Tax=Mahella australiensis (strain DSM 15567 / CIP 107919 / 50-1 BON) TaxID=697281 RepID=F4A1M3_MAHA5|nr:flagellar hook capping FlgD N-terminal domain-containing protein [Mahella australiensis]AEE96057.1 flagellar hook capping protein [Mahella australiensis 50-1 BON]
MYVNSINTMSSAQASTVINKSAKLRQDDFLKLLAAQMQNQNPLDPMDDKAFIAQMAQFSSLEQMQNMSANLSMAQAVAMIGKEVYATIPTERGVQQQISGTVDSVKFSNGQAILTVGAVDVPLENVTEVRDLEDATEVSDSDE